LPFQKLIEAVMAKDIDAALATFADDAVLIDPHYPEPRMKGRVAIERADRLTGRATLGCSGRSSERPRIPSAPVGAQPVPPACSVFSFRFCGVRFSGG
jgi:hypothetical protein